MITWQKVVISILMFSVYLSEENAFSWRGIVLLIANCLLWLGTE